MKKETLKQRILREMMVKPKRKFNKELLGDLILNMVCYLFEQRPDLDEDEYKKIMEIKGKINKIK